MKTTLLSTLRTVLLVSALATSALISAQAAAPDAAQSALSLTGAIPVKAVGDYVQVGSYRIWVSSHLGKPSATLADGSWLYNNFGADGSGASGTLVVRFNHGRVSELKLATPAYVAALQAPRAAKSLVALSR